MNKQYSPSQFNNIDVENNLNLLYVTVNPGTTKGFMGTKSEIDNSSTINLGVYDLTTDSLHYVFDQSEEQKIETILFEVKYSRRDRRIEYNVPHSFYLMNNVITEEMPLSENMYIVREGANPGEKEFWTCTKRGEDKKLVRKFGNDVIWKIDVKNRKAIFIKRTPNELLIESCVLS